MGDRHAFPSALAKTKNCKKPRLEFPKLRLTAPSHHHHFGHAHAHPKERMIFRNPGAEPVYAVAV